MVFLAIFRFWKIYMKTNIHLWPNGASKWNSKDTLWTSTFNFVYSDPFSTTYCHLLMLKSHVYLWKPSILTIFSITQNRKSNFFPGNPFFRICWDPVRGQGCLGLPKSGVTPEALCCIKNLSFRHTVRLWGVVLCSLCAWPQLLLSI